MAQKPPPEPSKNSKPKQDKSPQVPPPETIWTKYSPHYEFPLSTATSAVIHAVLGVVLLALVGLAWANSQSEPLPLDLVVAGGGGNPNGVGNGPGDGVLPGHEENVTDQKPDLMVNPDPQEQKLQEATPDPLQLPGMTDDQGHVMASASSAIKNLSAVSADARKKLFLGLQAGKGKGGPGRGGGLGRGIGTGEGDLSGPGKMRFSQRQQRVMRWTMKFNTLNGDDYRRQLAGLGAILAVPDGRGGYLVIRNLLRIPARGKIEDLADIKRIFWVDDKRQSVDSLSRALQLRPPPHIVAFFPEKLEKELLQKELKYSGGRQEEEIKETVFKVVNRSGTYDPIVESQTLK